MYRSLDLDEQITKLSIFSQKSLFFKLLHGRVLLFGIFLHFLLEQGGHGKSGHCKYEASEEDDAFVVRDPVDVEAKERGASDEVHRNPKPKSEQKLTLTGL